MEIPLATRLDRLQSFFQDPLRRLLSESTDPVLGHEGAEVVQVDVEGRHELLDLGLRHWLPIHSPLARRVVFGQVSPDCHDGVVSQEIDLTEGDVVRAVSLHVLARVIRSPN